MVIKSSFCMDIWPIVANTGHIQGSARPIANQLEVNSQLVARLTTHISDYTDNKSDGGGKGMTFGCLHNTPKLIKYNL